MDAPRQQMLLDLKPEQPPTLDNFVVGANGELLQRLRDLCDKRSFEALYIWGPRLRQKPPAGGGGRRARQSPGGSCSMPPRPAAELTLAPGSLLVIDDIEALNPEAQVALFRAFNAARFTGLAMLLAGSRPPLRLSLREDLRTRIGQTLIYEIQALSDEEKAAACAATPSSAAC
jgi:DnaA family protein